jgi:hypothetical protein
MYDRFQIRETGLKAKLGPSERGIGNKLCRISLTPRTIQY